MPNFFTNLPISHDRISSHSKSPVESIVQMRNVHFIHGWVHHVYVPIWRNGPNFVIFRMHSSWQKTSTFHQNILPTKIMMLFWNIFRQCNMWIGHYYADALMPDFLHLLCTFHPWNSSEGHRRTDKLNEAMVIRVFSFI